MAPKGEKKSDDVKPQRHSFTSRLVHKVVKSRQANHGMLLTVCSLAGVAECVNTLVTPSLVFRGVDVSGTFCNLSGAWLCGVALAWREHGARSSVLSDAFRGGFVAAYTSFCHVAEHATALHCGRWADSAGELFLVSAIFGGPLFFNAGRRTGQLFGLPAPSRSGDNEAEKDAADQALTFARFVALVFIMLTLAVEGVMRGAEACAALLVGVACAAAACQAGDMLVLAAAELMEDWGLIPGSANWGTIWANAAALLLVAGCAYSAPLHASAAAALPPAGGRLLLVVAEKFRGSFCGALSGYGAFSEDAATMLTVGKVDSAAASLGMNTLLLVVACALLFQAECPLGSSST